MLAVVAAVVPVIDGEPAAANVSIRVHQINICGRRCYTNSSWPTTEVLERVDASGTQPYYVNMQEVCFSSNQFNLFRTRMQQRGYAGTIYEALSTHTECGGAPYGNIVFALGVNPTRVPVPFPGQTAAEKRGAACISTDGYLGSWSACSTHLAAPVNSAAAKSQEDYFSSVGQMAGNGFRVMAGDFNLGPSSATGCAPNTTPNPQLAEWRAGYEEVDEYSPWQTTTDSGNCKIDYIWALDQGVTAYNISITEFDPGEPDHKHYAGSFSLAI
jgi:endonuclease/exonuclease/phosphatase family metal-dependent hydrolase